MCSVLNGAIGTAHCDAAPGAAQSAWALADGDQVMRFSLLKGRRTWRPIRAVPVCWSCRAVDRALEPRA